MTISTSSNGIETIQKFGLQRLSKETLEKIHNATLEVLAVTGVKVHSTKALEIFHSSGAHVERSEGFGIVRIPADIVEACLRSVPNFPMYYGRNAAYDFLEEPKHFSFTNGGVVPTVIDPATREQRPFLLKDAENIACLVDALDEIKVYERSGLPTDTPEKTVQVHNLNAMLKNTAKHIFCCAGSAENLVKMTELGAICAGGKDRFFRRPFFTINVCPSPPLMLLPECTDVVIQAAKLGIGVNGLNLALAGATSPVTLAGSLVQTNAEILSVLILQQLTAKGVPFTYGNSSSMMDLRTGLGSLGAPESGMISALSAQLAQFYGLPCFVGGAGYTNSKINDAQAAYESTLNSLIIAQTGANVIIGGGILNQLLTIDYGKIITDAEMFKNVRKVVEGIPFDDESLAVDVIHQVGPGGEFLTHSHTLKYMHTLSESGLYDWKSRDQWVADGEIDLSERGYEKAKQILETHTPAPLPAGAEAEMRSLISEYEKELKIKRRAS